jgi:hypothetical protein
MSVLILSNADDRMINEREAVGRKKLAGVAKVLGENLTQRHTVHHKFGKKKMQIGLQYKRTGSPWHIGF